jgi:hypothetical protein
MEEVANLSNFAVAAITIGALLALAMLLFFLAKNRVKTKWFSTNGKADLSNSIPRIDRRRDADLSKYVDDSKEIITASLPSSLPRMLRLLMAQKIRSPIYYRIQHNSLTRRFSTSSGIKEWKELVTSHSMNNINYIIDYCNLEPNSSETEYLHSQNFKDYLTAFYDDLVERFIGIIIDYCYEKMDIYKRLSYTELYAKNEKYIADMKQAMHS